MRKRLIWLTLIGLAIVVLVAIVGINLPGPVRKLIQDVTGIDMPRPDDSMTFKGIDTDGLPNTPSSFSAAKRLLYDEVYGDHRVTFYCGCPFDRERHVDLTSCGVQPRKDPKRAARLEAEHILPASHFGQHRQCWREPICTNSKGKPYKGRKCCEEIEPVFKVAHNDLHNLFPAVGEINGDRRDYRWGMISGEKRAYGSCDIEVDSSDSRKVLKPLKTKDLYFTLS